MPARNDFTRVTENVLNELRRISKDAKRSKVPPAGTEVGSGNRRNDAVGRFFQERDIPIGEVRGE